MIDNLKFKESDFHQQDIASLSDRPNEDGMTAAELKARFDNIGKIMIALGKHNQLIDAMLSKALADSGADNIGISPIDGLDGDTVQTALASLSTKTVADIAAAITAHDESAEAHPTIRATISEHIADKLNPHSVTAAQVGADSAGTAEAAVGAHDASDTAHSALFAEKANAADLASHTADVSNPHNVTIEQIGADPSGTVVYAVCNDVAASTTSTPNTWYVPKTLPKPSGAVGMVVDVFWANGHDGGLGYDVSLVWGEQGGADNEVIIDKAGVSDPLTGEYSIPTEGTVRYQLIEQSGRKRWQYVSGDVISRQFSTAAAADIADKPVHGMTIAYLPGMEIFVQLDNGNTASVMRLVPDEGATMPVYGNGTGASTGTLPAGYICHLVNAGDHWQLLGGGASGGGGGEEIVFTPDAVTPSTKLEIDLQTSAEVDLVDTTDIPLSAGMDGQFLASDGAGKTKWVTMTNVAEVGM